MAKTELQQLLVAVRSNPHGLERVKEEGQAKEIVQSLIGDRWPLPFILELVVYSNHFRELFHLLVEHYRRTPEWPSFISWVMERKDLIESKRIPGPLIRKYFSEPEDRVYILKRYFPLLLNLDHPLYGLFARHTDEYWTEIIETYLMKRWFRKAWGAFKQAARGMYGPAIRLRFYAADLPCRDRLLQRIFTVMVSEGLVSELNEGSYEQVRNFEAGRVLAQEAYPTGGELYLKVLVLANYFIREQNERRYRRRIH